jgi:hypothetical protein
MDNELDVINRDCAWLTPSNSNFYILADNNQQALAYCRAKGIYYNPSKVINTLHAVRGQGRRQSIKLIGTYWKRTNITEILELLKAHDWKIEYDSF